jgi:trimeric autotransporter adhesin
MANRGRSGLLWFTLATVVLLLVAGCKGFFVNPTLTTITVGASNGSSFVNVGATLQMVATGTFDDGSRSTITATWSSSANGIASVNAGTGVVLGVTPGTATITAASSGITGTAGVTVCGAITAITISPLNQTDPLGTLTQQFTAKDQGGNDITSSVTWSSTNTGVAAFTSGTIGLANLVGKGQTTIQATSCLISNSTLLTVD